MTRRAWLLVALAACGGGATKATTTPTPTPTATTGEHAEHEAAAAAAPSWSLDKLPKGAALLGDLGSYSRKVTTKSAEAQKYFDQGLQLTYGFNHDEAARSYARAGELDPSCAMCFWGAAYTMGPNYNVPMLPDRAAAAWDALGRAQKAAAGATPVEQALIGALAKRYKGPEWHDPVAQQPFNEAYAKAMSEVAKQFPDDLDVQTLAAEALMNVNPWKLWTLDGKPGDMTPEIVAMLEKVLARMPDHPGANHYYIHAVEASRQPDKAVPAADRLGPLMPAAGHAVHMPAHIYQRVGRYADAAAANRRAIQSDINTNTKQPPIGYYSFYQAHNYGFLAYATSMQGRAAESLEASRKSADNMPRDIVCGMPGMDFFLSLPLLVEIRFGRWQEVLGEKQPDPKYKVLSALWHHAHGMALAATGKPADARADLEALRAIIKEMPADLTAGLNSGRDVAELSAKIVEARIADAEEKDSIPLWREAVALEDKMAYSEPADWFYPTRHYLGAALLDARKAADAEAVYREDLKHNPKNGWALFGLWKSLEAQKKKAKEVAAAEKDFRAAWKDADIALTRSAF